MQKSESILSHAYLREILHYSIITGQFYRLKSTARLAKAGDIAGCIDKKGYICIQISGKSYFAHRLAWFFVTGEWPINEVDHKNRVRNANYWLNLRDATHAQNQHNAGVRLDSASGYKGVAWHKASQKWVARIRSNNERKHLGCFDDIEIAYAERLKAEKELHGEFACV